MEFRFDFFMNLLSTVFPIIMQVFIWVSVYSGSGGDAMYGYTFPQMIMYVVVAGAVSKFTNTGVEYMVNEDIHGGGIAKYLVRPVNYIGFRLCDIVGNNDFFDTWGVGGTVSYSGFCGGACRGAFVLSLAGAGCGT